MKMITAEEGEAIIALTKSIFKNWAPPPKWTISEWADNRRHLSGEASAEKGRWRTSRAQYQRGIMDAIGDFRNEQVVVMSSAQIGKTEMLLNTIGYYIDYDACPIMLVEPTLEMAEMFSKDRVASMIRDSLTLKKKISPVLSRDSGNAILHKKFPGGTLVMKGANTPSGLAGHPLRVILLDEVDRYPASAGTEGDPVNLAIARTKNFWNRRIVMVSTPTVKGFSRIEKAFEQSDQRYFYVPCPHCRHEHVLKWGNVFFPEGRRDLAVLKCPSCEKQISSAQKNIAVSKGSWKATRPFNRIAGFHLNELYSPWRTIADVAIEQGRAKDDPSTLQVWVNTSLGETWEERGERVSEHALLERCEPWPKDTEVPERVLVLTCGIDTQQDRLEMEVVGWAGGEESWSIDYHVIYGDPNISEGVEGSPWSDLTSYLQRKWKNENGEDMGIKMSCIDSAGSNTQGVYNYCKVHRAMKVFPIVGRAGMGKPIIGSRLRKRSGQQNRCVVDVHMVGVDPAKLNIYQFLRITSPGPGYCHFPIGRNTAYFKGLTAEKMVTRYVNGVPKMEWKKLNGVRNEPLDCRVYALAALHLLAPRFDELALERKKKKEPQEEKREQEIPYIYRWKYE
jgi:phage terminase large subunit GpA-like protein